MKSFLLAYQHCISSAHTAVTSHMIYSLIPRRGWDRYLPYREMRNQRPSQLTTLLCFAFVLSDKWVLFVPVLSQAEIWPSTIYESM